MFDWREFEKAKASLQKVTELAERDELSTEQASLLAKNLFTMIRTPRQLNADDIARLVKAVAKSSALDLADIEHVAKACREMPSLSGAIFENPMMSFWLMDMPEDVSDILTGLLFYGYSRWIPESEFEANVKRWQRHRPDGAPTLGTVARDLERRRRMFTTLATMSLPENYLYAVREAMGGGLDIPASARLVIALERSRRPDHFGLAGAVPLDANGLAPREIFVAVDPLRQLLGDTLEAPP